MDKIIDYNDRSEYLWNELTIDDIVSKIKSFNYQVESEYHQLIYDNLIKFVTKGKRLESGRHFVLDNNCIDIRYLWAVYNTEEKNNETLTRGYCDWDFGINIPS